MKKDDLKICCFTGHRPSKFTFKYNEAHADCVRLKEMLKEQIVQAINEGYNYFISGGALGLDIWAAETCLELKKQYPHIMLEMAIPCDGQELTWPKESQKRYQKVLGEADVCYWVTREKFEDNPSVMLVRDVYMVNKSSLIIAMFDGSKGGTKHTFDYAKAMGINIWRINPKDFEITKTPAKEKPTGGILECSSIGDPRYSAMFAYVEVFGKTSFIEDHYQLSKRFGNDAKPKNKWEGKGKTPTHFSVNGYDYDLKYLTAWYKLLWVKYLDNNPDLVAYAKRFDDYNDTFKGKNSLNCQADVIRQYIKEGRNSIMNECKEFSTIMKNNSRKVS